MGGPGNGPPKFCRKHKYSNMNHYPGVAQSDRALALGASGRKFESCHPDQFLKEGFMSNPTCPLCNGPLQPDHWECDYVIDGKSVAVVKDLECGVCEACGAQIIEPDQARRNHAKLQSARDIDPERKGKFEIKEN